MEDIEYQRVSGVEMEFDNISIAASVLRVTRNSMGVSNSIFDFDNSNRFLLPILNPSPPNSIRFPPIVEQGADHDGLVDVGHPHADLNEVK
jgi:hypothetical protein